MIATTFEKEEEEDKEAELTYNYVGDAK